MHAKEAERQQREEPKVGKKGPKGGRCQCGGDHYSNDCPKGHGK